ncbi:probable E3 ubiquitin-protein ligase HECTD2 [Caerostris extrusa]|uniref:Probable E3 ubiquitin-protein ligase HECTD2 n=1 Tax=Caerostris extrusa TaxID=172846 RepID=A0AAV4Q399_CAEEX|nr:probable E3 ubiquitin-protein ligase HECTD2 [Caerostris extrusa]
MYRWTYLGYSSTGINPEEQYLEITVAKQWIHSCVNAWSKVLRKSNLQCGGAASCWHHAIALALGLTGFGLKVKDETKALFALLHNPLFSNQSSYTVFAHLFRRIVALSSGDHQLLINWFAKTDPERLRQLVKRILQFVTIREFPPANGHKLPSISKSRWWIQVPQDCSHL